MKLMRVVYWLLAVPTALLACLVIFKSLGDQGGGSPPAELAMAAAAAVLGLVGWGWRLAMTGGRPGMAVLLVVMSWVVFAGTMVGYALMTQKVWN